ncbi:hypothetical protein V5T82_04510 [Magnetovibrio sp. PR-2]|uniref:hypothetical protein n=1 Tax=Magnetovibrio sp. PR-2 TaxID=3120356 RepID=UPI002FCE5AD3
MDKIFDHTAIHAAAKYSAGRMDRRAAMTACGIDRYNDFLDLLYLCGVHRPRLPDDVTNEMARTFKKIFEESENQEITQIGGITIIDRDEIRKGKKDDNL